MKMQITINYPVEETQIREVTAITKLTPMVAAKLLGIKTNAILMLELPKIRIEILSITSIQMISLICHLHRMAHHYCLIKVPL